MPDSADSLSLDQRIALQMADPELHDLLAGTATAALELAATLNQLSDSAPSMEQRQEIAKQLQIQNILEQGNPWASESLSVTAQFTLEALDPKTAAKLQKEATPAAPAHQFTQGDLQVLARHGYVVTA